MRMLLAIAATLVLCGAAVAQFNGCPVGFCVPSVSGGGGGPPANALLSQTGTCILAQTGSCIMVQ